MSSKIILGLVFLIIIAGGAYWYWTTMNTQPSSSDTTSQATTTPVTDQVQGQDVVVGTGAEAKPGSIVSVLYKGALVDGTVFDSSEAHGNEPLKFTLGTQDMIPGFQVGVNGMKEGGKRRIAIPPSLAYGANEVKDPSGKVLIPANSTIIFDIELIKVEEAPAPAAQ